MEKIITLNNNSTNQDVDYISHSSIQTCKQSCMGFLFLQLGTANGNVHFRYSIMPGAACGFDISNAVPPLTPPKHLIE
jgi:hypothetical protein